MAFGIAIAVGRFRGKCRDWTGGGVICRIIWKGWFGVVNPLTLFVGGIVGLLVVLPSSCRLCGVVGMTPVLPVLPGFPSSGMVGWLWIILVWSEVWIGSKFDRGLPCIGVMWRSGLEIIFVPRRRPVSPSGRCGSYGD